MGLVDDLAWAWSGSLEALVVTAKLLWLYGLVLAFVGLRLLAIYCCARLMLAGARRLYGRLRDVIPGKPRSPLPQQEPALDFELARLSVVSVAKDAHLD